MSMRHRRNVDGEAHAMVAEALGVRFGRENRTGHRLTENGPVSSPASVARPKVAGPDCMGTGNPFSFGSAA